MATSDDSPSMWFRRGHDALFEQAGLSPALRETAAGALAALYTPDILQRIMSDSANDAFFQPLFGRGWPLNAVAFLEVGLDLSEVTFEAAGPLLKRFLVPAQFRDAAFELRVWASLRRSGYVVSRVQEGQTKTPDYLVKRDGVEVDLEVKFVNESAADDLADEINNRVAEAVDVVPGFAIHLHGDDALAARLLDSRQHEELKAEVDDIVRAFHAAVEGIRARLSPGRYPVSNYGIASADLTKTHPRLTPDLFPQQSDEKKAQRVLRLVRDAKQQATGQRPLVAVVGVFHQANPVVVEAELRSQVRRDGRYLQPVELVVLVAMVRNSASDYTATRLCYPIAVRNGRQPTQAQLRIARAASGSYRGPAELIRASLPGEQGMSLGPARRATTRVLLQQLSADPTSPITFSPLDPEGKS